MRQKTVNNTYTVSGDTVICNVCGREYELEEYGDFVATGQCPSDDCPSRSHEPK